MVTWTPTITCEAVSVANCMSQAGQDRPSATLAERREVEFLDVRPHRPGSEVGGDHAVDVNRMPSELVPLPILRRGAPPVESLVRVDIEAALAHSAS